MQLRPRFTSACGSPCVAMTRLSLTATVTPQPVPQKRHGALSHCTPASERAAVCACAGRATPAAAPAAVAAERLMNSRLRIVDLLVHRFERVGALVDERRREHAVDASDRRDLAGHLVAARRFERDDELAVRRRRV